MKVTVIGGGAAGCLAAVELARGGASVTVLEAGAGTLKKVSLTGGGRCNLTNSFRGVEDLQKVYPRGARLMQKALRSFGPAETMRWFENEGVRLVTQPDNCVFPASQDAMQIVRTLRNLMKRLGVEVVCRTKVVSVEDGFVCRTADGGEFFSDRVLVASGGNPRFLGNLGLEMVPAVPSLFTMRIDDSSLTALQGTLADVRMSIAGTAFRSEGTLLVTDWGISGPATLKLSSYAARYLADNNYSCSTVINWLPSCDDVNSAVSSLCKANPRKLLASVHPEGITARLWEHLIARAALRGDIRCAEVGPKGFSRLCGTLVSDSYPVSGRARFKEEFVTAGGVALKEINPSTMECRKHPGLYFAGEVLDIDAVTGGFNLQAAWSTGYCAAVACLKGN